MKLLAAFLAGLAAGIAVSWAYIWSLRTMIKTCEDYIHQRLDRNWNLEKEKRGNHPPPHYNWKKKGSGLMPASILNGNNAF